MLHVVNRGFDMQCRCFFLLEFWGLVLYAKIGVACLTCRFKLSAFVDGSIGASICRLDGQVVLAVCFLESGGCGALGWRSVTTIGC